MAFTLKDIIDKNTNTNSTLNKQTNNTMYINKQTITPKIEQHT